MGKLIDMSGIKIHRLLVIGREPNGESGTRARWLCRCDCGKEVVVDGKALRRGWTKSCGCLRHDTKNNLTHNMSKTRFYRIWFGMKKRCNDPGSPSYKWYGEKGITYDRKWEGFEGFYDDMFASYNDDLTLERIDPREDYSKENCKWIPLKQQQRNKTKRIDNSTGVTGVFFEEYEQKGRPYCRYLTVWMDTEGKRHTKSFACKKYGYDQAFQLACEYRSKMIAELNEQGAGYSETHGL